MSTNLYAASRQWATRPADERFWSVQELHQHLQAYRHMYREGTYPTAAITAVATPDNDVRLTGPTGREASLTHWSFGQLCQSVNAPADYMRRLPAPLACECLNHEVKKSDGMSKLLFRINGHAEIRSITTEQYSRIYNVDVVERLLPALDNGWKVPPARPSYGEAKDSRSRLATQEDVIEYPAGFGGIPIKVGDEIAPAGVYCSDRDLFIFLVNPHTIINDGGTGLMRGVFIRNSEVGSGALSINAFLLEGVCGNHIVWGAKKLGSLRIIHKGRNNLRYSGPMAQALANYANSRADEEENIRLAKLVSLGKDKGEVIDNVYSMRNLLLTKGTIESAYDAAVQWEHTAHAVPTSAWGFVHGLTRYSQTVPYTDERTKLDIAAGKLLEFASKS